MKLLAKTITGICLFAIFSSNASSNGDLLRSHQYVQGESFEYYFEDFNGIYKTVDRGEGVPFVTDLNFTDEYQFALRLSIVQSNPTHLIKTMTFLDTKYRRVTADKLVGSETIPYQSVPSLIPSFPTNFTYTYDATGGDGLALKVLVGAFAPYLVPNDQGEINLVALRTYVAMTDVHTFQAAYDGFIPKSMRPGQVAEMPKGEYDLGNGDVFVNHQPLVLFQRTTVLNGLRGAYFKVINPGNYFKNAANSSTSLRGVKVTNYQYTFFVPIEGPMAGIVTSGELQEMGIHRGDMAIQRQLSFALKKYSMAKQ